MSTTQDTNYKEKILGFLNKFDWEPESVSVSDDQYIITLLAQLDIKEIKINLKFSEDSHWIYFSALFLPEIKKNYKAIYEKLLQINYTTTLTKFGISPKDNIYALIELPLKTLDYHEFISALRRLTNDINKYLVPIAALLQE